MTSHGGIELTPQKTFDEASKGARMDKHLVLKALKAYKASLDLTTGEGLWEEGRVDREIERLSARVDRYKLLRHVGGSWLGETRDWIKCRCRNGCDVMWGSQEELKRNSPWTVLDIEEIAARAAAAAINEYKGIR